MVIQSCSFNHAPDAIRGILAGDTKLYGHNLYTADFPALRKAGLLEGDLPLGRVHDTMLSAHVTHGHLAGEGSYDLRSCCLLYGQDKLNLDWKDYAGDIFTTCRYDAAHSLWIGREQERIIKQRKLESTWEISHRIAPMFQRMYERGVKLDKIVLELIHQERESQRETEMALVPSVEKRKEYKRKPAKVWNEPLNYRSPAVIKWFAARGVKLSGRSREDFEQVASNRKVPAELRELAQRFANISELGSDAFWVGKKTADGWEKIDQDGFCHPEYKITGTPDRPSCVGTNIQNFPRPKEDPRKVPLRQAVIPSDPSKKLIACDYKSIENITNAFLAGDKARIEYVLGRDFHQETTDKLNAAFSLGLTRHDGKAVNHAFDKGESPFNLSVRLGINPQMAEQIVLAQLRMFPVSAQFRKQLWEDCRQNPYRARTPFGRELLCFGRSRYGEEQGGWTQKCRAKTPLFWCCTCNACSPIRERFKAALAFLGRATAVDILLRRMALLWEQKRLNSDSLPLIECHDEGVWESSQPEQDRKIVMDTFSEPVLELDNLSFPCEAGIGSDWANAKT